MQVGGCGFSGSVVSMYAFETVPGRFESPQWLNTRRVEDRLPQWSVDVAMGGGYIISHSIIRHIILVISSDYQQSHCTAAHNSILSAVELR